jgi:hypothetical protein
MERVSLNKLNKMKNNIWIILGIILFVILPAHGIYKEIHHPKLPPPLFIAGVIGFIVYNALLASILVAYFIGRSGNQKAINYIKYFAGR